MGFVVLARPASKGLWPQMIAASAGHMHLATELPGLAWILVLPLKGSNV